MSTETKQENSKDLLGNRESENCSVNLFDKICRICFTRKEISNIFKQYYKRTSLNEIINTCFAIQVEKNDGLPQNICKWCTSKVTKFYTFRMDCQQSDAMLKAACNTQNLDFNENNSISKTVPTPITSATNGIMIMYVCVQKKEEDMVIKSKSPHNESKVTTLEINPNTSNMAFDFKESNIEIKKEDVEFVSTPSQSEDETTTLELNSNSSNMALDFKDNNIEIKEKDLIMESTPSQSEDEATTLEINSNTSNMEIREDDIVTKSKQSPQTDKITHKISKINPSTNRTIDKITNNETMTLEKTFSCKQCDTTYDSWAKYMEHRNQINHGNHICEVCNKSFSFKCNLKEHVKIHTKERPYHCQVCSSKFSRKDNLRRHVLSHTGERPFKCTECGKDFVRAESLAAHKNMHAGEKFPGRHKSRFMCTVCDRHLSSRSILQKHLLLHGEKTFLCNYCGKSFYTDISLNSHMIGVHSGMKHYVCKVCNKKFAYAMSLRVHMTIHTGKRSFVCRVCSTAFKQSNHLQCHMRTHTGEKPFVCTVCGKSFALKHNCAVHMRRHTGEKPFVCDICEEGFYDSKGLRKHKVVHEKSNVILKVVK